MADRAVLLTGVPTWIAALPEERQGDVINLAVTLSKTLLLDILRNVQRLDMGRLVREQAPEASPNALLFAGAIRDAIVLGLINYAEDLTREPEAGT